MSDKLNKTLTDIQKMFGKKAIGNFYEVESTPELFSTGSIKLDKVLGGFPEGRIIEIYGPEGSGKTTLSIHTLADVQKKEHNIAFIDMEGTFDPVYANALGLNVNKLIFASPNTGEEALEITEKLVRTGEIKAIVIDSVATLLPSKAAEGDYGDANMGLHARLMSQGLKKLLPVVKKNKTMIIFINQLREKIGVMFGCLHADTLINFADGRSISIREVVENKIKGEVYCFNEKTKQIETQPIINWHFNGKVKENKDFLHIQTTSINGAGRFGLTCTPNHKILKKIGNDTKWVEAKSLKIGDSLISKYMKTINGSYSEFLNGMSIGDSYIYIRNKNTAQLKIQDNANLEYAKWKIEKLSPFLKFEEKKYGERILFSSKFDYELKKVKKELENRNPLYILEKRFSPLSLAIWYMDDGHFDNTNSHSRCNISIKRFKNNKEILNKIVEILKLKLNTEDIKYDKNGSIIFNKKATDKLHQMIYKFIPPMMQYKLKKEYRGKYKDFELTNEPKLVTEEVKVKEIRIASNRQMRQKGKYDITVRNNSNYMVGGKHNGIIVHNSPETTTGGNSLKFYASVRLDIRKYGSVIKDREGNIIGEPKKVKIIKSKINNSTGKEVFFDIIHGKGIDVYGEVLDLAVEKGFLEKSGSWYSYDGVKIAQGREASKQFLKDNPELFEEIKEKL